MIKRSSVSLLKRTIDDLHQLRLKIENELIPEMIEDARILSSVKMGPMSNIELAEEIIRRKHIFDKWDKLYTDEFIPFAHGIRLFGQVYNDVLRPSDPYEFMNLLSGSGLLSIKRNKSLAKMADILRSDPSLRDKVQKKLITGTVIEDLEKEINTFLDEFGHSDLIRTKDELLELISEMALKPGKELPVRNDNAELEEMFLSSFPEKERSFAEDLLDMGRISYRLRDDDNIYLGRIEDQYLVSLDEAKEGYQIE